MKKILSYLKVAARVEIRQQLVFRTNFFLGIIMIVLRVLILIALGASFQFQSLRGNRRNLILLTAARLVAVPALGMLLAYLIGLRGNEIGTVLICAGSPMATTAFPMAQAYDSDYELAGQLVVVTSLLCCLTMFLWIFCLKQAGVM